MYPPLSPPPPLNPFPHLVEALDKAIRADLESIRFSYFVRLLTFTGFVFLGIGLEIGEIWHDVVGFVWRRRIEWEYAATPALIREKREPSHKIKMFAAVGWLLIVIGVGGEGYFEGFVSWTDSTLQTFNNILLEAAHREAGDAAASAKVAREEADAAKTSVAVVKKQSSEIKKELDTASSQLGDLEEQVRFQGPRWKLLEENKNEFTNALEPFTGQRIRILYCGDKTSDAFGVADDVPDFLPDNWVISHGAMTIPKPFNPLAKPLLTSRSEVCSEQGKGMALMGIFVITSDSADKKMEDAADALAEVLNKIGISATHETTSQQVVGTLKTFFPAESGTLPWEWAVNDPTSIVLLVGAHPMRGPHKDRKK